MTCLRSATMTALRNLCLGGDGNLLRVAHINSLDLIDNLPHLETLLLHGLIVDSKDYSPLLSLQKLKTEFGHGIEGNAAKN